MTTTIPNLHLRRGGLVAISNQQAAHVTILTRAPSLQVDLMVKMLSLFVKIHFKLQD